jgi:hypothetical protein
LFSVTGAGTVLDLSALQSLRDDWNDGTSTTYRHLVEATNGGRIDLSGLMLAVAPARAEDRLDFVARRGGRMDLDALRDVSGGGQFRFDVDAETWELPLLERVSRTTLVMAPHAQTALPKLRSWSDSTISLGRAASLALPSLVSFTGGTIQLEAGQTLQVPVLSQFDNSLVVLSGGAVLALPITSYAATGRTSETTLFSVTGRETELDLSGLRTIDDSWDDGSTYYSSSHAIVAAWGGRIDLSGIDHLQAPVRTGDRLRVVESAGGQIDLAGLRQIASAGGQVELSLSDPALSLPKLNEIENASFLLPAGGTLTLSMLSRWDRGAIVVPPGATFHIPALNRLTETTITIGAGGRLQLPELREFVSGVLTLGGDQTFEAPQLRMIDHSRIALSGGAQLVLPTTQYSVSGVQMSTTLLSVDGPGTLLDLGALRTLDAEVASNYTHTIRATAGAGSIFLAWKRCTVPRATIPAGNGSPAAAARSSWTVWPKPTAARVRFNFRRTRRRGRFPPWLQWAAPPC